MQHTSCLLLLFALFAVPRVLQRFRIPTAITRFALGAVCALGVDAFAGDPAVRRLATLPVFHTSLPVVEDELLREGRA